MSDLYQPVLGPDLVVKALSFDPDRPVIILDEGGVVTARDLREAISRHAQALSDLSPRPLRAALLTKNRAEVPAVFYALAFAGIVSTALHPMGSVQDHLHVLADAAIDLLVFDEALADTAAELRRRATGVRHFRAIGEMERRARDIAPLPLVAPCFDPESIARIAYSGGTTGQPKGIMVTHRGVATSTMIQLSEWEWPAETRHLVCAPLSHAGASMLTSVLLKGGAMVVLPGFDPVSFMAAVQKHRITSALMVPTMVLAVIDHPRFAEFDLSSLDVIYYGASAFPAARLQDAIDRLGPVFFQFYGQAEAPMSITLMRRHEHLPGDARRLASCGRPTPWVHVALLDEAGRDVGEEEPGEICVRGPLVMAGYLGKPDETAAACAGGWLHTGDIAIRGADGFYRIVDRKKDMIVTGGFNVYAREVEDVLVTHPAVLRAAVIGVPDPRWGEAVKAVVVTNGQPVAAAELIALVRAAKGPHQAPKSVDFVDAIPLSPVGKPDKKALRVRYGAA